MKKFLALLLAVLSIVSLMSLAFFGVAAEKEEDVHIYAVVYAKGGVPVMYEPTPSFRFDSPGWVTVSADTPLASDYEFVCWQDKDGNRYDPGDKIYVNTEVKLTPVMAPKSDGDDHTVRTIKTAFQALIRVLGKAFGFFKTLEDFNAEP